MNEHWKSELIRIIQECRSENSDQRFGQFLYNLISESDKKKNDDFLPFSYSDDFHHRLFNIEDTELVSIIKNL